MDNRIMQQVLEALSEQRAKNEREELRRRQEVIQKCPAVGEIMMKRQQTVLASIYSAFQLPVEENLEEKVLAWNAEIKLLLKQNGFPENYLEPVCQCEKCEDTGYVGESKKTLCTCAQNLYAKFLEKGGFFEEEQSFEAYNENIFPDTLLPGTDVTQRAYMNVIRRRCEDYANALPVPAQKTLLLYGGSGLGKTYLLRAIHARARENNVPAICLTANSFLRTAREAYFSRDQQALDALYETELLLIDDLGTEPMLENITVEQLFNLINERQNARLCTVLSTNLTLTELKARYTERVLSRLLDKRNCLALHFLGEDIRLK
ncbi:MAG: ATP-binding protein [Clostridia bacterium]|nr:ATP-binding protein [Clostridia bacterium]